MEVWFLSRGSDGGILASRGLDELQFLGVDLNTVGPYWYSEYLYRRPTPENLEDTVWHKSSAPVESSENANE